MTGSCVVTGWQLLKERNVVHECRNYFAANLKAACHIKFVTQSFCEFVTEACTWPSTSYMSVYNNNNNNNNLFGKFTPKRQVMALGNALINCLNYL